MASRSTPTASRPSSPFDEVERAAWGGIIAIHGRLMHEVEEDLRINSGLTHPEFEVLLRLYFAEDHRARIQDLAADSILTPSGMSRLVSRLEERDFVIRHRAEEDGRGAYAELTKRGQEAFATAADHHISFVRGSFLSKFTRDELRMMGAFWERLDV